MEVIYTDEFRAWYEKLATEEKEELDFVVRLLEILGIKLSFPHSSAIESSSLPLRELRPKKGRSPFRIVYAFDPRREAVLLIGGDKREGAKFYERLVRDAERIWEEYLEEQATGLHDLEERKR